MGGSANSGGGSPGGKTTESSSVSTAGAGGASQGGATTGGAVKGGATETGGAGAGATGTNGGNAAGRTATGGMSAGGAVTGGVGPGGAPTAGATVTGGSTTGGSTTGGSGTGGSTGTSPGKGSPGCNSANPLKSGTYTEKINNVDRQYIVDVPSGYDNSKPTRLIFVWHPLGGTASQVANGGYNGLKSLSNNTTIFVAPNGLQGSNSEASGNGWWNVGDVDMKFLEAMLKKLNENLCIDQERIFTTGFSFGGMMSYTVPFVFNVFRATAPCSGKVGVISYTEKYNDPIPIMAFHGNNDTFVKTSLGKEFLDKYRMRNKCGTETKPVSPSPCVEYQGCVAQTIWCEFPGAHEIWSQEASAIWNFFKQF